MPPAGPNGLGALAASARAARAPRIESRGEGVVGAFPFSASRALGGCVHVRIDGRALRDAEISFLRFVASSIGLMLRARTARESVVQHTNGGPRRDDDAPAISESAARRYVAMAVHDLRNPLNVIAGYTALLDEESLGDLTAQQREAVDAIKRQARVLLSSVDQLIELDRMPRARSELCAARFEVGQLFEDLRTTCFAHCATSVHWPGHEATFDFTSDRRRLFSIAQNLIDNALKHAHGGDIVVDCTRRNGHLNLRVCDQGPGLDPELRAKLVNHAASGTESAPRSGLGLYTVASHVHALHGAIAIEVPESGRGTDIRVSIPAGEVDPSGSD
jgi:signal transduction histidine kinase